MRCHAARPLMIPFLQVVGACAAQCRGGAEGAYAGSTARRRTCLALAAAGVKADVEGNRDGGQHRHVEIQWQQIRSIRCP